MPNVESDRSRVTEFLGYLLGTKFALVAGMKKVAAVLGCVVGLWGCSSTTASTVADVNGAAAAPLPEAQQSLLGSFEADLQEPTSSYNRYKVRVDLVNLGGSLAVFLQGPGYGIPLTQATIESIDDTEVKASLKFLAFPATLVIKRKALGATPEAMVLTVTTTYGTTVRTASYAGLLGADDTPPSFTQQESAPPWEMSKVHFSEALLEKDIKLPVSNSLAMSLLPIPGTPWVGALGYRRPLSTSWDDKPNPSGPPQQMVIDAKDPSGNAINGAFYINAMQIGKATKAYDFAVDSPAFPQVVNRLLGDCDGAPSCLRVSQGATIGLRVSPGNKALRIRYALRAGTFEGTAPKTTVNLTAFVAPGDGSATNETKPIEVTWSPTPTPTETRAFATAYADLVIPLPKVDAETGMTIRFDGEPRVEVPTDPQNPLSTVKARHMVLLVKSAIAE